MRAQTVCLVVFYVSSCQPDCPFRNIIKPGDQIYKRGLAGAGSSDHSDSLPPLRLKRDIGQRFSSRIPIRKRDMGKFKKGAIPLRTGLFRAVCRLLCRFILRRHPRRIALLHIRLFQQYFLYTVCTGHGFCHGNDQISQFYKFHQYLGHVVQKRHNLPLGQVAYIYAHRTDIDEHNNRSVYDHIGKRVHQTGDASRKFLGVGQQLICRAKPLPLLLLLIKGTDHPGAGQVFPGCQEHLIQSCLHLPVKRHGDQHDAEYNNRQQRNSRRKYKSRFGIHRKRHDHGSKYDKRRPQEKAQHQIDSRLHLVDVAGQPRDQSRCAYRVHLCKRKALDVDKESMPYPCPEACRRLCRKILRCDRADQSGQSKRNKHKAHPDNIRAVTPGNAHVDHSCHYKRHEQFKRRLQHLKERRQYGFFFVLFQINEK